MGKRSAPPPPATPDYAEIDREAVFTDIETLPTRRLIEAAARQGTAVTYADPRTGATKTADFTGFGDIDLTRSEMDSLVEMVPQLSQAQLDNITEFGPQFVEAQREQLRQSDPEGFALREEFTERLRSGEGGAEEIADLVDYEEVGPAPEFADTGRTSATREEMDAQILDALTMGDRLNPAQQRALEQGVRRAAAARGQALGTGAGLREAIAKLEGGMQLGQQRRAEAADWLGSGQASSDKANALAQQSFANTMQRVQQVNQARQVGSQQQLAGRQQDVGNIQSYLGLQPIAAQGGYLAGVQQGASPFTMPQMQRGAGLDPNAAGRATQFAGNVFGTEAGIWNTQVNQPTTAGALGGLAGSVIGAAGAARGFGKLFS